MESNNKDEEKNKQDVQKIRRERKRRKEGDKNISKKKRHILNCMFCSTKLSPKYSFCPECGNMIPKSEENQQEIEQMQRKYLELEKENLELEKQLREYEQQFEESSKIQTEEEKMVDLMWLVASIPKPLFDNQTVTMSDYNIKKISPGLLEFLGYNENKQLLNYKMSKILPSLPPEISQIHTNHINNLSHQKDCITYCKEEVKKKKFIIIIIFRLIHPFLT